MEGIAATIGANAGKLPSSPYAIQPMLVLVRDPPQHGSHEENPLIHSKQSTQNKKVHVNKFIRTISVGFLTRVTGKRAKVCADFSKKFM